MVLGAKKITVVLDLVLPLPASPGVPKESKLAEASTKYGGKTTKIRYRDSIGRSRTRPFALFFGRDNSADTSRFSNSKAQKDP